MLGTVGETAGFPHDPLSLAQLHNRRSCSVRAKPELRRDCALSEAALQTSLDRQQMPRSPGFAGAQLDPP